MQALAPVRAPGVPLLPLRSRVVALGPVLKLALVPLLLLVRVPLLVLPLELVPPVQASELRIGLLLQPVAKARTGRRQRADGRNDEVNTVATQSHSLVARLNRATSEWVCVRVRESL